MASKQPLFLLLLVASATSTQAYIPFYHPITNVSDPKIQTYGSMAVDSYNKWTTGSHLIFKEVWAASSAPFYFPVGDHLMNYILRLTAIKCSQSGALGNYSGQVLEKEQGGVFTYSFGIFQELVS